MTQIIGAKANPEKRFFISLLTRDIPLVAAFLDIIDNSINAAVEPYSSCLESAQDYLAVLADETVNPSVTISVKASTDKVEISDTAGGIDAKTAAEHVFKFGRGDDEGHPGDRLSVYGIGLKRAMFKLGNRIVMRSDHINGGFDMDLNVSAWAQEKSQPWTFAIKPRHPARASDCGTTIQVTELYDDVKRRVADGVFEGQLRDNISKTYAYYLAKFVEIKLNDHKVEGVNIGLGVNNSSEHFEFDGVSCLIAAGIGTPEGNAYRDRSSGWFVFCNGRAVVSADKIQLTG
jgi:hypothetical protein